jgi:hypothetical protein
VVPVSSPFRTVSDLVRILVALPGVERERRRLSLHQAVTSNRSRGASAGIRSGKSRAIFQRLIGAIDRRFPGGPNCVRRSLLEMRLDAGAARERLFAGFKAGGGASSGHAWLESHQQKRTFDAVITI